MASSPAEAEVDPLFIQQPRGVETSLVSISGRGRGLLAAAAAAVLVLGCAALRICLPQNAAVGGRRPGGAGPVAVDWSSAQRLFEDEELHEAVSDVIAAAGHSRFAHKAARAALQAEVARGFSNASDAARRLGGPGMTPAQRARLLKVVRRLADLHLQGVPQTAASGTYEFECSGEDGVGTGTLGSGIAGSSSASDVAVHADSQVGGYPKSMNFTVGPPVGCCGEHVISGRMDVLQSSAEGLSGNITAGFVNLRSTLRGTWESGAEGLQGTLHIRLSDLGMEEEWTWAPVSQVEAI